MDKLDLILWVMSGGFTVLFTLMIFMWNNLNSRSEVLGTQVNNIDKRLYGIETMLHMKDCCVLKNDQNLRKAE